MCPADPFRPDLLSRRRRRPRKVALVRPSRIGDFLRTTPAFRAPRGHRYAPGRPSQQRLRPGPRCLRPGRAHGHPLWPRRSPALWPAAGRPLPHRPPGRQHGRGRRCHCSGLNGRSRGHPFKVTYRLKSAAKRGKYVKTYWGLEWPSSADVEPNVLHEWPQHVDAIGERRKRQFALSS